MSASLYLHEVQSELLCQVKAVFFRSLCKAFLRLTQFTCGIFMSYASFHDVRFPISVSRGAKGGPERKTDIITLGSGIEHRNARHAHSRRRWNAGYGVKSLDALHRVIAFFEERRGRLYGFRWRDPMDYKSCTPSQSISPMDQTLGMGDGEKIRFPLIVRYGVDYAPYMRPITKPLVSSVRVALNSIEQRMESNVVWDSE